MECVSINKPGYLAIDHQNVVKEVNIPLDVSGIPCYLHNDHDDNVLQNLDCIEYRLYLQPHDSFVFTLDFKGFRSLRKIYTQNQQTHLE